MERSGKRSVRRTALALAAALAAGMVPAGAAEMGDGVRPTCDEAYYATLDYYGNLTQGSVVKSYALNGADTLTDYGTYDEVVNLTDGTRPVTAEGKTTFQFGEQAPSHFYFEGKTARPFEELPWTTAVSYTLNGVPARAEDLAGKTGVVEIRLDILPNENAAAYARDNYTLEAMALFNQDDILSLEAKGAQVQLVGNLRMVLFIALPGEEDHYVIRVGAEDFSFDGLTLLMVPATLAQLDMIAELGQRKDELEEDYETLSGSLDTLLNSVQDMSGSLYTAAAGLEELNGARDAVSQGKGQLYDDTDRVRGDLGVLSGVLAPVTEQVDDASSALTRSTDALKDLTDKLTAAKSQLNRLREVMKELQADGDDVHLVLSELKNMQSDLKDLEAALRLIAAGGAISGVEPPFGDRTEAEVRTVLDQAQALHTLYEGTPHGEATFAEFVTAALTARGETPEQAAADAAQLDRLYTLYASDPAGFTFLLDHYNTMNALLTALNRTIDDANGVLGELAGPAASLAGRLAAVSRDLGDLHGLLNDSQDAAGVAGILAEKGTHVLDSLKALDDVLNGYEPKAQEALKTVRGLGGGVGETVRDVNTLLGDAEALLQESGGQLDAGTQKTLTGLAEALRQTARSVSTTGDVKEAKSSMDGIVQDTWHEHTGGVDHLLNMDSTARAVSLTSGQNAAPASIQVLMRTQEIKVREDEAPEMVEKAAEKTTFRERVGRMFRDFWGAVTGIFH